MKERPILFSAPMVRAILEGRKTQTRQVVKDRHIDAAPPACFFQWLRENCPYGQPGDRLWVRETWRYTASSLEESRAITEDISSGIAVDWRATYIDNCMKLLGFSREEAEMADDFETWRPSIHMPRWASRILLEVTGVRVERLQDISEADSLAEGVTPEATDEAINAYERLWESINGPGSWEANPWVWVVEFKRVTP